MTLLMLNLEQQHAIDRLKEELVPAAEAFLDEGQVIRLSKNKFGDSQLRNLIAIANETESPAVVLNFIRYQIGRDTRGQNWASSFGSKSPRSIADRRFGDGHRQESAGPGSRHRGR